MGLIFLVHNTLSPFTAYTCEALSICEVSWNNTNCPDKSFRLREIIQKLGQWEWSFLLTIHCLHILHTHVKTHPSVRFHDIIPNSIQDIWPGQEFQTMQGFRLREIFQKPGQGKWLIVSSCSIPHRGIMKHVPMFTTHFLFLDNTEKNPEKFKFWILLKILWKMEHLLQKFVWFNSLRPCQQSFSYVRTGLPGLNHCSKRANAPFSKIFSNIWYFKGVKSHYYRVKG